MLDPEKIRYCLERFHDHAALRPIAEHPWFKPPSIEFFERRSEGSARYTMVVPIFNQEHLIGEFLQAHIATASVPHEIIAIFDCCVDDSMGAFRKSLDGIKSPLIRSVAALNTSVPYFETACDNLGFALATTDFIIEFQPDMLMDTKEYDARLLAVLKNDKVFCASGRCGHSLRTVYGKPSWPSSIGFRRAERQAIVGLFSSSIEKEGTAVDDTGHTAWFSETVNRGPIAFRRSDLVSLNYLDHRNFFLGDDDHDLNLRAFLFHGKLPAYVPIKIRSDLAWGSTRRPRDPLNAEIYKALKARPNTSALARFKTFYKPYCSPTPFLFSPS